MELCLFLSTAVTVFDRIVAKVLRSLLFNQPNLVIARQMGQVRVILPLAFIEFLAEVTLIVIPDNENNSILAPRT